MSISDSVLTETYIKHYSPLIREFTGQLKSPKVNGLPGLSLPLFGGKYKTAPLKILIVGRDDNQTLLNLKEYFDDSDPLGTALKRFQKEELHLKGVFWQFTLKLMAAVHGYTGNLKNLPLSELSVIRSYFAWANVFPITYFKKVPKKYGIQKEYWNSVLEAGSRFYGFRHVQTVLRPNVVIVMYKNCPIIEYIRKGYGDTVSIEEVDESFKKEVKEKKLLVHYIVKLLSECVHVFHVPHPRNMNSYSKIGGQDFFSKELTKLIGKCS